MESQESELRQIANALEPNDDAGTDFGVAGLARIREMQRGDLKPADICYTHPHR